MKKWKEMILRWIGKFPIPVWYFLIGILTYGLLINRMGFFLDDWYIVLFQKSFGVGYFAEFFKGDRPFLGYVYDVFVPIFGDSRIGWQLLALVTHVLSAIVYWRLLEMLVPKLKRFNLIAGLFFLVYPGFKFHWFSVMYSQVFFLYTLYFLSMVLMVKAIRVNKGKIWFAIGAIFFQVAGIVPQESFLGLELVRPILLFIALKKCDGLSSKEHLKRTFFWWLPYLFIFLGFSAYRVLKSSTYSYQVVLLDILKSTPGETIISLANNFFSGLAQGVVAAWTSTFNVFEGNPISTHNILLAGFLLIFATLVYLIMIDKQNELPDKGKKFYVLAIWIGIFAAGAGILPFLAGGFQVKLEFPNNRYLIALAPGAALFLSGMIEVFLSSEQQKRVISAFIIGMAMTAQLVNARTFELNWKYQQEFFWQLYWRAPVIEENTLLVSEDVPFSRYSSSTSLTSPLNLLYAPDNRSMELPYAMVLFAQQNDIITEFSPGIPVKVELRSFIFSGNTNRILLFKKPSNGCLRILTSNDTADGMNSTFRKKIWQEALVEANANAILVEEEIPEFALQKFFGAENQDQWCYYFEKADLARQQMDWNGVISVFEDGLSKNFTPHNQFEWLPLIEAYLRIGETEKALEITRSIPNFNFEMNDAFCKMWTTIEPSGQDANELKELMVTTKCD